MRARHRNLSLGALAGVVLVAILGAGGFPSRPKFQAVGINTPALARGTLALVPDAPGGGPTITVAATAGNAARAEFAANANVIGTSGMLYGQDASNIGYLWNRSNTEVRIGTNNLHRASVTADGTIASVADPTTAPGFSSVAAGGGRDAGFLVDSVQPSMALRESDAAADNRMWDCSVNAEVLECRAIDDANAGTGSWIAVNRTGTTIDSLNLTATAVQVNGEAVATVTACTTVCDAAGTPIGGSAFISKATATSRNTTTTDTADPDLQFTNVPIGTYAYEWYIPGTAGSGSGLKGSVIGTSVTAASLGMQECSGTGSVHSITSSRTGCLNNTGSAVLSERGTATVAASTTMSVGWSQGTSTVNNSTVPISSWFRITRIK